MANTCAIRYYLPGCFTTNASTPGQPDGQITVNALDPNSMATIRYNLNADFTYPSGGQTSGTFTGLVPGTYTVYARNATDCRAKLTLTVGFNTAYAVRHRLEFNDLSTTSTTKKWRFDILDNQYIGPVNYEEGAGQDPVVPSWRGEGSEEIFDANVISSEVSVSLNSPTDQYFIHLYTFDETRFKGKLYLHDGSQYNLFWEGYLTPMLYSEPYVSKTNYDVNLIFTDRLADLKEYEFTDNDGNIPVGNIPVMNAINYCLLKTKMELNIWESVNFYATGMLTGTNDSTLEQMYIDPRIYQNEDGTMKDCLTVLQALMDFMGTRIYQSNGRWNIDLITQKTASSVPTRKRTYLLQVSSGGNESPRKLLRRINQPAPKVVFTDGQQTMSIPQTYGTININYTLGIVNNLLSYGNFEIEDLANGQFKGWYADLSAAPDAEIGLEKLVEPRGDSEYAFYVNFDTSQTEQTITLTSAPVPVYAVAQDYKLAIQFDLYTRPIFTNTWVWVDVAVKIGTKYLKPVRGVKATNQFTTGGGALMDGEYFRFYINDHLKWTTLSIDAIVEAADSISGDLVVEFRFSSNAIYDLTAINDLKTEDPTYKLYDTRRRVKAAVGGVDLIWFYNYESDIALAELSPDILRVTSTTNIWRLEKTVKYPKDSDNNNYESWLQSLLLDNVIVDYRPAGDDPVEEVLVTEIPNPGVRQTLKKEVLHGDLADVDDNYRYIARGLVYDSTGDPWPADWKRTGVSESRSLTELLAKMIRGQYQELRWKLIGKLYMPDDPLSFWNTLHETRTGKVYQFMALTLYLRSREADIEAIETLAGADVVDETTPTASIPSIEPPVAERIRIQPNGLLISNSNIVLTYTPPWIVSAGLTLAAHGITFTYTAPRHDLVMETTEAVAGTPVYQAAFVNTSFSNTLTTTGTQNSSGFLRAAGDVTATVTRTGLCDDTVDIFWFKNGVQVNSVLGITAGSSVNESYTYTSLVGTEELKVTITEG